MESWSLGHKGFVWAKVTTAGRAAHGSRWDVGVSAIGKMAPIITALEEFDRIQLRQRVDPLVGPASLHCALISGGVGLSTYAPGCELQVERRTLPGETAAQVRLELDTIVRRVDADAVVECFFHRPPLASDAESRLARVVRDAIAAVTGRRAEEGGVQFWMDAAIFANAGIPTVNYGPTGAGAHEAVEWVDLDSVVTCANVLLEAANRFCSAA
jgi:acetylornithine deacetylase